MKFEQKFIHFHSTKSISKYRLAVQMVAILSRPHLLGFHLQHTYYLGRVCHMPIMCVFICYVVCYCVLCVSHLYCLYHVPSMYTLLHEAINISYSSFRHCNDSVVRLGHSNFHQNTHNRHPIARPVGRGMGCLSWVQSIIFVNAVL